MSPTPLSQWADQNGIARRTAYNWAKSGRLNVPIHRTRTGRLVVLDDPSDISQDAHPFVTAYAEALGPPAGAHAGSIYHSPVLEAWGIDLYDAVAEDLRPLVLQLASVAACGRPKVDVWWRLVDWLGRVELANWYAATDFPQIAALLHHRGEITDEDSFNASWPTGPPAWKFWTDFRSAVDAAVKAAGLPAPDTDTAAGELAEIGLVGLDHFALAPLRESLRMALSNLAGSTTANGDRIPDLPAQSDLWDLRNLCSTPMYALARPYTRRAATLVCAIVGWDPESPAPPAGHRLAELGYPVCTHTARTALQPHLHNAHIREIHAFRRIALGKST
jgi:hypothetical protein